VTHTVHNVNDWCDYLSLPATLLKVLYIAQMDQSSKGDIDDIRHRTQLVGIILYHIRHVAARVAKLNLGVHLGPNLGEGEVVEGR